jgi:hypothetical protein
VASMSITKWTPLRRNTLRGFVDAPYGSLNIQDIAVHSKNGRSWAQLPSKPMISSKDGTVLRDDTGRIRYTLILAWKDKVSADRFSEAIVAEIIRVHGAEALDDGP